MEPKKSFLQGVNKYLIIVLVVFFILLLIEILIIFINNRRSTIKPSGRPNTTQESISPTVSPLNNNPQEITDNEKHFNLNKEYYDTLTVKPIESINDYHGSLTKIDMFETGKYRFALTLLNDQGKIETLRYQNILIGKTGFFHKKNNTEEPIFLSDFQVGDKIIVEETLDLSKNTFLDAIVYIKIIKL